MLFGVKRNAQNGSSLCCPCLLHGRKLCPFCLAVRETDLIDSAWSPPSSPIGHLPLTASGQEPPRLVCWDCAPFAPSAEQAFSAASAYRIARARPGIPSAVCVAGVLCLWLSTGISKLRTRRRGLSHSCVVGALWSRRSTAVRRARERALCLWASVAKVNDHAWVGA